MEQRIRVRESVALGAGVILIGDSTTNISNTTPVLLTSHCLGYLSKINMNAIKSVRTVKKAGSSHISDIFTNIESLTVSCDYMELTPKNTLIALGGDGTTGVTAKMSGEISLTPNDAWHRLEIYFTYPNKINRKVYIIPKVKVVSPFDDEFFKVDAGIENSMEFQASSAIESTPRSANWKNNPLGKVIFQSLQ